jgi:hypothetical protein
MSSKTKKWNKVVSLATYLTKSETSPLIKPTIIHPTFSKPTLTKSQTRQEKLCMTIPDETPTEAPPPISLFPFQDGPNFLRRLRSLHCDQAKYISTPESQKLEKRIALLDKYLQTKKLDQDKRELIRKLIIVQRIIGCKKQASAKLTQPVPLNHFCQGEECEVEKWFGQCELKHKKELKCGDIILCSAFCINDGTFTRIHCYVMCGIDGSWQGQTLSAWLLNTCDFISYVPKLVSIDIGHDQNFFPHQRWEAQTIGNATFILSFSQLKYECRRRYNTKLSTTHLKWFYNLVFNNVKKWTFLDLFLAGCLDPKIVKCITHFQKPPSHKVCIFNISPNRFLTWLDALGPTGDLENNIVPLAMYSETQTENYVPLPTWLLAYQCCLFFMGQRKEGPIGLPNNMYLTPNENILSNDLTPVESILEVLAAPTPFYQEMEVTKIMSHLLVHGGNSNTIKPNETFEHWKNKM